MVVTRNAMNFIAVTRLICSTLVICSFSAPAQVKHISLHALESAQNEPLSVKLNIVEKTPSELKFILINQGEQTTVNYTRLNDYMLRIKGTTPVKGNAVLAVYQQSQDNWQAVKTMTLFDDAPASLTQALQVQKAITKPLAQLTKPVTTSLHRQPFKEDSAEQCQLIRQPKETLWSIASRYKKQWGIDVYSAMIAIYHSNLNKFANQHIGRLMHGANLQCPTTRVLSTLGSKKGMYHEFNRLNQRPKTAQ